MHKNRIAPIVLSVLLLSVLLVGCEENNTFEAPSAPDTVTILTSGIVTANDPGKIKCEDRSSTIPADEIQIVEWTVREPGGSSADGGTTAPRGEISFTGLAPGDYTVEQVVILKDGSRGPAKTYDATVS